MGIEEEKVITVAEYRKLLGEVRTVKLPSGAVFKIRRLSVMDYIKEGLEDIPNEFFTFIAELSAGKQPDSKEMAKSYALFEKFLEITIQKGVIEPPLVLKYDKTRQDTHLVYAELDQEDQKFLIDAIQGKGNV